jgi:hypothetical protein
MKPDTKKTNGNYIDQKELNDMIEQEIASLLRLDDVEIHNLLQQAKNEGWLGSTLPRDYQGLLGYYRTCFGKQIKILKEIDNSIPIYYNEFLHWFRGDHFKNATLKNQKISVDLIKHEHFDIIKNKFSNINNASFNLEEFINNFKKKIYD